MTIYTTRQAAMEAGVSHATANRHAKKRDMPRIGKQFAIPENRFAQFVAFLKTRRGNKVPLGKGRGSEQARRKRELRDAIAAIRQANTGGD